MKYAVGLMAMIGIAFFVITSPDRSQMHAQSKSVIEADILEAGLKEFAASRSDSDSKLDSIIDLLAKQQVNIESIDTLVAETALELEEAKRELNTRLVSLETARAEDDAAPTPAPAMPAVCDCNCDCKCEEMAERVATLEKQVAELQELRTSLAKVSTSSGSTGGGSTGTVYYPAGSSRVVTSYGPVSGTVSYGSTGSAPVVVQQTVQRQPVRNTVAAVANVVTAPAQAVAENYRGRWTNHDGLSRMQHAREAHWWMETAGKTEAQILAEMDAYHDMNGPDHLPRPVQQRVAQQVPVVMNEQNCPNGQCPQQGVQYQPANAYSQSKQVQSSGGWYLGKALGRRR